jgi:hypothetical protein
VSALAPWLEVADPVRQLAGRTVLLAHGDQDRVTDPERSYAYNCARGRSASIMNALLQPVPEGLRAALSDEHP